MNSVFNRSGIKQTVLKISGKYRFAARIVSYIPYFKYVFTGKIPSYTRSIFDVFIDKEKQSDRSVMKKLIRELFFCRYYYQITEREYFIYQFENLSEQGRHQYVGVRELKTLLRQLNMSGQPQIIDHKEKTYDHFQPFFHRDALLINMASQQNDFVSFLVNHSPCFLKPLNSHGGLGIQRLEASDSQSAEKLFEQYTDKRPFLLEEAIHQSPEMAIFHPQSINSIRYNTFFYNGHLTRMQAAIRIGRGQSYVDNATSGGIYALVDIESGLVITPARSENGERFLFHPDTGVQILGAQIPRWNELNALLEQIVRVIPEQKQVGWDFALTPDGWVLIESNSMPAIQSFDFDHGMRKLISDTFGQVIPVQRW